MSKVDVSRRFFRALMDKDNFLSVSLPLVSDGQEIIFFYHSESSGRDFALKELDRVIFRDLKTSELSIREGAELFSTEELRRFVASGKTECITGVQALERVKKYHDLHERLLSFDFGKAPSGEDILLLRELFETFVQLVPESGLREVYCRLGRSLFMYIYKYAI